MVIADITPIEDIVPKVEAPAIESIESVFQIFLFSLVYPQVEFLSFTPFVEFIAPVFRYFT